MELTRTIHPVGQGGFYTESFKDNDGNDYMVAYDCGGNNKRFMEDYLKKFIHETPKRKKMKIDAIFISHLHADHINGLKYLLDNTDVKYLLLPQINNEMLIEVLSNNDQYANNLFDNQELTDFILYICGDNKFYRETRIVKVSPATNDDRINIEEDNNVFDLSNDKDDKDDNQLSVQSGTKITFGSTIPQWLYIPYNPPVCTNNYKKFYSSLKELSGEETIKPILIPDLIKKHGIEKIKIIYEENFGSDHNSYSMALFSGLLNPNPYYDYCDDCFVKMKRLCRYCRMECRKVRYCNSPNCLYMGDFDTQNQFHNLKSFYGPFWKTITSIQVPHHGSRNNYHSHLYDYACKGFVSAGTNNKYNHPNIDTLINICSEGCRPIVVTDNISTMHVSKYWF